MKIIAKTDDGYIIEATSGEIANLCGYYSKYGNDGWKPPVLGDQIQVSQMYQQLYGLVTIGHEIVRAQNILRDAADLIEPVVPIVSPTSQETGGKG